MELAYAPHGAASGPADGKHRTTLVENGNFCVARCSCGWAAPARRSRDKARRDAAQHAG